MWSFSNDKTVRLWNVASPSIGSNLHRRFRRLHDKDSASAAQIFALEKQLAECEEKLQGLDAADDIAHRLSEVEVERDKLLLSSFSCRRRRGGGGGGGGRRHHRHRRQSVSHIIIIIIIIIIITTTTITTTTATTTTTIILIIITVSQYYSVGGR